jgi:hypothetical protein
MSSEVFSRLVLRFIHYQVILIIIFLR